MGRVGGEERMVAGGADGGDGEGPREGGDEERVAAGGANGGDGERLVVVGGRKRSDLGEMLGKENNKKETHLSPLLFCLVGLADHKFGKKLLVSLGKATCAIKLVR